MNNEIYLITLIKYSISLKRSTWTYCEQFESDCLLLRAFIAWNVRNIFEMVIYCGFDSSILWILWCLKREKCIYFVCMIAWPGKSFFAWGVFLYYNRQGIDRIV